MPLTRRLAADIVATLRDGKTLRLRAGTRHRFIGIWVVVVQGRVFVRSWSVKPRGWYRTLLEDARAFIQLGHRTIAVRAVRTRSHALRDAVDQAYLDNYANINLQPGYQLLTGGSALEFVRFRHTDSDLYRLARQQEFVRAFKEQIAVVPLS